MSRMDRVKYALGSTVSRLREQIETSHKNGKIPADYSLGFCNAMIFAHHHVNMIPGEPKFYDRTTSIGTLPKPTVLKPNSPIHGADEIYESLRDSVILAARNGDAKEAIKKMDDFVEQMASMEAEPTKEADAGLGPEQEHA